MITAPGELALSFLNKFRPAPWFLSIGKKPEVHQRVDTPEELVRIVNEAHAAELNTWFRLGYANECTGANGSMQDADVRRFILIPIDIDIPKEIAGKTVADRDTWRSEVVEKIQSGIIIPVPSVITSSGNGIQVFYAMESAQDVREEYEGIVYGLAQRLTAAGYPADTKVRNASRLMRLPVGCNYKSKVGDSYPQAYIIHDNDRKFQIEQLFGLIDFNFKTLKNLNSPVAAECYEDLSKLYPGLRASADTLLRMHKGPQPGDPERWNDESRCMASIVAHLVARGNSDIQITRALTQEGSWTLPHLEDKDNPAREVRRKLEFAHSKETCIAKYNREFAIIKNYGGKARIAYRQFMTFQDPHQWELGRLDEMQLVPHGTGNKLIPSTKLWLHDADANRYEEAVFEPGLLSHPSKFNMWTGWSVIPKAGDWSLFRQHLLDNVCSGNQSHFEWLLKWMAFAVQKPYIVPGSAIVISGGEGSGKGTFTEEFARIFGKHHQSIINSRHLTGDFNLTLQDCILLTLNESIYTGSQHEAALLKGYITDEYLLINPKGVNAFRSRNALHIIITTNSEHAVLAGHDARRFFCLRMSEAHKQDWDYFGAIRRQMNNGGREAMMHDLMSLDLTDYSPGVVPQTDMLNDQRTMSLDSVAEFVKSLLEDGRIPGSVKVPGPDAAYVSLDMLRVPCKLLYAFYKREYGPQGRLSSTKFGMEIRRLLGTGSVVRDGSRYYLLPPLSEARARFCKATGTKNAFTPIAPNENMIGGLMDDTGWLDGGDYVSDDLL